GQLDAFSRDDLKTLFSQRFGLPENRVEHLLTLTDGFSKSWGKITGRDPGEYYAALFAHESESQDLGETLYQGDRWTRYATLDNTKGFFSKMRKSIQEELGNREEISVQELEGFLRKADRGIKADEVEWTGLGDMIRAVAPQQRASTKWPVMGLLETLDRNEIQLGVYVKSDVEANKARAAYDDVIKTRRTLFRDYQAAIRKAKTPEEYQRLKTQ